MTYASLTPLITYRSAYPNLFSTLPSALTYINVIEGLMNTYEWQKLVVVSQLENEFDLVSMQRSCLTDLVFFMIFIAQRDSCWK